MQLTNYRIQPNVRRKMIVDVIHTANLLDVRISELLKGFALTHSQFNILRILNGVYPDHLAVKEVRNRMVFPNSDTSRLLDRMLAKGLIDRKECPSDRRKSDVSIAKKGVELLQEISPVLDELLGQYFESAISAEEAELVSGVLNRITQGLQEGKTTKRTTL